MEFQYMVSGHERSTNDSTIYTAACLEDLTIPDGKYYLADAGFGVCNTLLVPYRGVRYHLHEWRHANIMPCNREELFNLHHARACNVIERIFGVVKEQWDILNQTPSFDMSVQAQIPAALAALHNFILKHDQNDIQSQFEDPDIADPFPGECNYSGILVDGYVTPAEQAWAKERRDSIAQKMWEDYQI
ncbi:uncharacterized protein ARMOST_03222 [Armillaria ostoyae]|uniref:DDE Tnp4 domain-containing protein n=1 Tax=Armillaria ostoyae TaxID=47428 RepID=A0A284QU38_ARMOS|nr:uncharacterized protein ARMOST_03222 [Armillaria ostoyae]